MVRHIRRRLRGPRGETDLESLDWRPLWEAIRNKAAAATSRGFGSVGFLGTQTAIVLVWMAANALHWTGFDPYPFILLNLAFSLQAAYTGPLVLLAQNHSDDKRLAEAEQRHAEMVAHHRETMREISELRQQNAELRADLLELRGLIERAAGPPNA